MSDFWTRKGIPAVATGSVPLATQVEMEQVVEQSFQEAQEVDFQQVEQDEDDDSEVLSNASLRLEQGRLYQMIIGHDIFGQTDADPKAIKNVQREIRKFARERMEIMLGMRQDTVKEVVVAASQFNELEVIALKTIAAQMSKGATKQADKPAEPVVPKKDGITAISGTTKVKGAPQEFKPLAKNRTAPVAAKVEKKVETPAPQAPTPSTPVAPGQSFLTKPIDQMSPDELLAYDKQREERMKNQKAALPPGYNGVPSSQELEQLYTTRLANVGNIPGSNAAALVRLLGNN